MSKHRSLAEALLSDPKKLEFIRGGKPEETPEPETVPEPKDEEKREEQIADSATAIDENKPEAMTEEPIKEETAPKSELVEEKPPQPPKKKIRVRPKNKGRGVADTPKQEAKRPLTHAVVPVTTRFRQDIAEALRRASLERKLSGESPSTQQDIIEQCVASWLDVNGYLDGTNTH